ncbi:hypothetical protein TIFTF001_024492 [Ficus carica]|uniref:Glycosyltransferase 61 catalytic domain-containing protein n=1 Tax=Ficus carica TaxID=3494 RepID=A0AA88APZ4_FICCA|nr:hypothetical protein TIFTF001_024492 [Ficus carica]
MVHYQRYHQWRKVQGVEEDEEAHNSLVMEWANSGYYKRTRPKLLSLLLLSLLSCTFVFAPHLFGSPCSFSLLCTICCDRSSIRTDVCTMKGDVRTHSGSSSIFLYGSRDNKNSFTDFASNIVDNNDGGEGETGELQHEKVKPYTRKWETSVMDTVDELDLISRKDSAGQDYKCDVYHDVPAVFFSTGGYTGNVYHEFNDGIIPLYITSQHFKKKVVFVVLEYHNWWVTKYGDVLKRLSDYKPIDFRGDLKTHCFPEAIVGLKIHGELTVDASLMAGNKSIVDFRRVLDRAYWPRIKGLIRDEERETRAKLSPSPEALLRIKEEERPKLLILSRNGSRSITNEDLLVKMAGEIGFRVQILSPDKSTELAKIYRALNSSDVMIGVHGAAMTHFLFMRPGSVFIQVIPLGTVWAAETYYGEPAKKLGLKYIGYKIQTRESSLYDKYDKNDPVLRDPSSVTKRGWQFTKSIYLDGQNVKLDLGRFRKHLVHAYEYSLSLKNTKPRLQSQ